MCVCVCVCACVVLLLLPFLVNKDDNSSQVKSMMIIGTCFKTSFPAIAKDFTNNITVNNFCHTKT